MKRGLILLFVISSLIFAGGEISFEKQKQKERRLENAQLDAIRNNVSQQYSEDKEEQEKDTELNLEEEQLINLKIQKTKKKTLIKNTDKLVSYIKTQNNKLNEKQILYILNNVFKYSKENDMDPYLVLAVMNVESHFKHSTVSTAGAKGLMQLMPFNFTEFGVNNSIEQNIKGGVLHLKRDYDKTNSIAKTLVCYNAGCERLKNNEWKNIKETREYIPKVIKNYKALKSL